MIAEFGVYNLANLWAGHLVDVIDEVGVTVDIGNDAQLNHAFGKMIKW